MTDPLVWLFVLGALGWCVLGWSLIAARAECRDLQEDLDSSRAAAVSAARGEAAALAQCEVYRKAWQEACDAIRDAQKDQVPIVLKESAVRAAYRWLCMNFHPSHACGDAEVFGQIEVLRIAAEQKEAK